MYKIVSPPAYGDWCHLCYRNTLKSFLGAMWFYVDQLRLPTIAITFPMAFFISENDAMTKSRLMVGAGLLNASIYMVLNKMGLMGATQFQFLSNVNSVMTNMFFLPVVWDGSFSKFKFLMSSEFELFDDCLQHESQAFIHRQLLAELLFSSTGSVAVFALLAIIEHHSSQEVAMIESNLCLIKSGLFTIAQVILKYNHNQFEDASDDVQRLFSEHVRNLLYESLDGQYVYLNDFFWSSIFYNVLLMGYSLAAKFQNCDGPLGPNGEPTCMGNQTAHGVLNTMQILFNLWVAVSFFKKGIMKAQQAFPVANRINARLFETCCQPIVSRFMVPIKVSPVFIDVGYSSDEECKV